MSDEALIGCQYIGIGLVVLGTFLAAGFGWGLVVGGFAIMLGSFVVAVGTS